MIKANYATPRCPGTLKDGFETYNPSTLRGLFLGKSVFHVLTEPPLGGAWEAAEIKGDHFGQQQWFGMQLEKNKLVPDFNGGWLLKTVSPGTSQVRFPMEQAGNEHLCLQLASQVYNLETVPNALIFFPNGQPALVCRNLFSHNAIPAFANEFEDFEQLNERLGGISDKDAVNTYLHITLLIDKVSAASVLMKERFFTQLIFSWLIANGSAYMNNFGVTKSTRGDLVISPLFNMLCTRLHDFSPEVAAPGGLFNGDRNTAEFREYGHYTRNEFVAFGRRIGLMNTRVEKILDQFIDGSEKVNELIEKAFLPDEAKNIINFNFMERLSRLK